MRDPLKDLAALKKNGQRDPMADLAALSGEKPQQVSETQPQEERGWLGRTYDAVRGEGGLLDPVKEWTGYYAKQGEEMLTDIDRTLGKAQSPYKAQSEMTPEERKFEARGGAGKVGSTALRTAGRAGVGLMSFPFSIASRFLTPGQDAETGEDMSRWDVAKEELGGVKQMITDLPAQGAYIAARAGGLDPSKIPEGYRGAVNRMYDAPESPVFAAAILGGGIRGGKSVTGKIKSVRANRARALKLAEAQAKLREAPKATPKPTVTAKSLLPADKSVVGQRAVGERFPRSPMKEHIDSKRVKPQTAKQFRTLVESHTKPNMALERGLDYYGEITSKMSTAELQKVGVWITRQKNSFIKQRLGGNVKAELRGRGETLKPTPKPSPLKAHIEAKKAKAAKLTKKPVPTTVGFMGANPEAATALVKNAKGFNSFVQNSGIIDIEFTRKSVRESAKFEATKGLVHRRAAELEKAAYEAYDFRKKSEKGLKKQEKEDMIFFNQRTGNPYMKDRHAGDVYERLSPAAKRESYRIASRFERIRKSVNESGASQDLSFIENYVTQMWRGGEKAKQKAIGHFRTKNPFAEKRVLESYREGIELGLKPRYRNIYDILESYEHINHRVIQNNLIVKAIKELPSEKSGPLITASNTKAPVDYVRLDSRALSRAVSKYPGRDVWVHPEIAKPLQTIFTEPFSGRVVSSVNAINAVTKKLMLSVSLFHHLALTESALYSGIAPWKFRKGKKLLNDKGLRNDAIEAGLDISPPSDVHRGMIDRGLAQVEASAKDIAIANKVATGVRRANQMWDAALWDHYHRGLKSYAYNDKVQWALKKNPNLTPAEIIEVKRSTAKHVNNAFGGQNWDVLLKSPRWRQVAHWAFLAPDWTLSNIKIASSAFKNKTGGVGARVEGQLARRYWARAALVFTTSTCLLNKSLSGHWPWENEEGHKWEIDTGTRNDKGQRQYIQLSKQVREPIRWVTIPWHEALVKAAPVPQMISEQATGKSLGGWHAGIDTRKSVWQTLDQRSLALVKHLVPISLFGSNVGLSLPIRRGAKPKAPKKRNTRRGRSGR